MKRLRIKKNHIFKFLVLGLVGVLLTVVTYSIYVQPRLKPATAAWYGTSGWQYRKALVIDASKVSGSSNLTNFPVLVSRTDNDLKASAQSDGDDILFTSSDGSTKLDHEIETYTSATGELIAWVEIPTLDYDDDTTIYMYYGNSSASSQQNASGTWDSSYILVQHLAETSGQHLDSTSNNNDSNSVNVAAQGTASGKINGADDFESSSNNSITIPHAVNQNLTSEFTIEAWINPESLPLANSYMNIIAKYNGDGSSGNYYFQLYNNDATIDSAERIVIGYYDGTSWVEHSPSTANIQANGSHQYVAGTYNNATDTMNLYKDGVLLESKINATGTPVTTTESIMIGNDVITEKFDGIIDEIRISNTTRSADYFATQYANQNDPSTFFKQISTAQSETQGNTTPDISYSMDEGYGTSLNSTGSNNHTGTITGALWRTEDLCVSGKCLYFDGSNDVITTSGTTSGVKTISFWVRPMSTTEQLVDLNGTASISVSSGTISATSFTSPTIYVDGKVSSTLTSNRWQHVTVTTGTGITASALKLGQISTNYGQLFMDEFQLFSTALTADQVKSLYNSRGSNLNAIQFGAENQKALSDGLVGYWKMDESSWTNNCSTDSVLDTSGNGNNGDACPNSTGPIGGASGKFANSGIFDGTDDYLNPALDINLDNESEFTVGAWVKTDSNSVRQTIYSNGHGFNLEISPTGRALASVRYPSDWHTLTGTTTLNTSSWYHLLLTHKNGQRAELYVNGALEAYTSVLFNHDQSPTLIDDTIGVCDAGVCGSTFNFDGSIDDVRVFNRALSAAEVKQLYTWAPGPVAHWKLDEKSGTTVYDSSGFNNSGIISGSTAQWKIGKYGSGISASTNGDHIAILDSDSFDVSGGLSVGVWVKNFGGDGSFGIVKRDNENSNNNWILWRNDAGGKRWEFKVTNSSGTSGATDYATSLTGDAWTYVTGTWDGNNIIVYENGIMVSSSSLSGSLAPSSDNLIIEMGTALSEDPTFDDIRIYNYARTPSQIIQDMNAGHPLVGTPVAGPIAHWSFDEGYGTTANDNTPNNNDLTLNSASWTNDGKFNKAWNGTGSTWLTRADDSDFDFAATDDFTLSAWIKSDSSTNPSFTENIIDKGDAGPAYALLINSNGELYFAIDDDASAFPEDQAITIGRDFYDGQWHHVVATKTGTSHIDIYVDGILIDSDTSLSATGSLANSDFLNIGDQDASNGTDEFNGDIDEVKIYRAALSASDVLSEYNLGKSLILGSTSTASDGSTTSNSASREFCVPGDTTTCPPPIAQWSFDEGSGTNVNDISGGGSSGIWTGSGSPRFLPGKFGKAGNFTGETAGDHINITSMTSTLRNIASGNNQITISGWIYPRTFGGGGFGFILSPGWGVGPSLILDDGTYYNDSLRVNFGDHSFNSNANTITLNTWQHVAITYIDASNAGMFYVNGIPVGFNNVHGSGGLINSTDTWDIGNSPNEANRHFDGLIDELKVYDYARTPAQIAWDYNKGKPIAHWQFDETNGSVANDNSGNELNGTLTNSPSRTTSGKFNSALTFNGSNYITINDSNLLDFTSGFSVSAWVNFSALATDYQSIITKGTISPSTYANYYISTLDSSNRDELTCGFWGDITTTTNSTNLNLQTGQWYNTICVFDDSANTISLYVNGKLVSQQTNVTTNPLNNNGNIDIGDDNSGFGNNSLTGSLDDIRIYNYPLTAQQVKLIMNDGSAIRFGPQTGSP